MTNSYPAEPSPLPTASADRKQAEDQPALPPAVEEILKPAPGGTLEAELTAADADIDTDADPRVNHKN